MPPRFTATSLMTSDSSPSASSGAEPKSIKWHPHILTNGEKNPYALQSACGRWIIGKAIVADKPIYSLWDGQMLAGRYQSADQAKKQAEHLSMSA